MPGGLGYILGPTYDEILKGYIQAYTQNMQNGIKRLNIDPQTAGVTSINGALLFSVSDCAVPARGGVGNLAVGRFYNSKIWYADSHEIAAGKKDHLRAYSWLGMGWNLHFGCYYESQADTMGLVFESPAGSRVYYQYSEDLGKYVATDGSFNYFKNDTIKTSDGALIVFNSSASTKYYTLRSSSPYTAHDTTWVYNVNKIIDPSGNFTSFYYSTTALDFGFNSYFYGLDSILTSTQRKVTFHYHADSSIGYNYVMLDSIKYKVFNNSSQKIAYHYIYDSTTTSPFGHDFYSELGNPDDYEEWFYRPVILLRSIIFPNGDSVYYDYNDYYELSTVHASGGTLSFDHETYHYQIPKDPQYPPEASADEAKREETRAIRRLITDDDWSNPDTTEYRRFFRGVSQPNHGLANADSVMVYDPAGNYQTMIYLTSGLKGSGDFTWYWTNGQLKPTIYHTRFYDKNSVLLSKTKSDTKRTTSDSITVLAYVKNNNGLRTYQTTYCQYDSFGNPTLIHEHGDTALTTDDRWLHRWYAHQDDSVSFWLHATAVFGASPTATVAFYSLQGIDTLIIRREWSTYNGGWHHLDADTFDYNPAYKESETVSLSYTDPDTFCRVTATVKQINSPETLHVYAVYIISATKATFIDTANCYKSRDEWLTKRMLHVLTQEETSSDSAGSNCLMQTYYFYDDTANIVKIYSLPSPVMWETPVSPCNIRGNLTRIQQWKGGSDYTKSELRYDQAGNVVQSITHASSNAAETTFTHFNKPNDSLFAYPWRVVNHLSTSVCSLQTKSEYDSASGLVKKTFNANNDSIAYDYDLMNRLKKVWYPGEGVTAKKITYRDLESPKAVIESTYIYFDGEVGHWGATKTFYNGSGRPIQTKVYDYNSSRTIITNMSYNKIGLVDSVCNAYAVSGTADYSYSSPSWSDVTSLFYNGAGRIAKTIYPTGDSIRVKYYANKDTTYDEKGNKTVTIKNAYNNIDTIIGALPDTTVFFYDTLGRLTKVKNAKGLETRYYYDYLSRLRGIDQPDAESSYTYNGNKVDEYYAYDDLGSLYLKKDHQGWTQDSLDDLYRLIKVKFSTDSSSWSDKVRNTYDINAGSTPSGQDNPKGRLTKLVTAGIDSAVYFYDDRGRLGTKKINIVGMSGQKIFNYAYNYADLCTLISGAAREIKTRYQYNTLGQITGIPGLMSSFTYKPSGQLYKIERPSANSVLDSFTYDTRLRNMLIHSQRSGTDVMKLKYYYEANSNVDSIADYVNTTYHQGFAYDGLNRLTNVYSSAGSQTFTYDKTGNRLSKNGTSYYYWVNTDRIKKDQRGDTCWYDQGGNLIKRRNGATLIDSFAYNWADQLIYYKKGQEELDFAYNASGLRVKKHYKDNTSGNEDTTYYVYDWINPLAEYSSGGTILAYYIYANGKHIARVAGADTNWFHCDVLGSPRKVTNESGSVVWTGAYYPFGEMITGSGNVHGFTGKELDSEMSLNYFCKRYYDPQAGRFTQLDPQDSPVSSPYAYCYDNPLKYKDPTGQASARDLIIAELFDLYEKGKEGRRSYLFYDYDQYGNLTSIDYWDPWSANNPYLENFTIPPAEYFAASYSVKNEVPVGVEKGKPLTYQEMIAFMRNLYYGTMYGGAQGKENALNYKDAYVFNVTTEGFGTGYIGRIDDKDAGFVRLDMLDINNSFSEFALTIFHEGCHVGANNELYAHKIVNGVMNMKAEYFAQQLYYRVYMYRWWFNY